MITEKQLQEIREEAEKLYPGTTLSSKTIREVHINAATAYALRAKGLLEALEKIVKEAELGIVHTSGKYINSLAQTAINNYKNNK